MRIQARGWLRWIGLALLLGLALSIAWHARRPDPLTGQERAEQLAGTLDKSHRLEQRFLSGRDELCALEVFARIPPGSLNPRYSLTLHLREDRSAVDIAALRLRLSDVQANPRVTFPFPAQRQSRGKLYRLVVETDAPQDTVSLLASRADVYPAGELLQDGQPTGRDLTFRAFTGLGPAALWTALVQSAPDIGILLLFTLLLMVSGGAALALLDFWPEAGWAEIGLWSVGIGLAFIPLLYLLIGQWTGWVLAGLIGLAALRSVLRWRREKSARRTTLPSLGAADATLAALFGWALVVRMLQVTDIPAPMWMDGLSHVQMAQSVIDAGRIPAGLLYHIGFHTHIALLHSLSGLPLPRLIVLFGQLVSALTGPGVYVLAKRLIPPTQNIQARFAAPVLAALALAAFPDLPSYLINWGRYPFLLGLTLLPFVLALTMDTLQHPPRRATAGQYGLWIILLAGMLLCHYGMASFWISFTAVWLAVQRPGWMGKLRWKQILAGLAVLAAAMLLARFLRFGDDLWGKIASTVAESRQTSDELNYAEIWRLNVRAGGLWLVLTGCAGGMWAAWKARRALILVLGWFAAQTGLIALQAPLLGYALASYANLLLALPIPLAILSGGLLDGLLRPVENEPVRSGPLPGGTSGTCFAIRIIAWPGVQPLFLLLLAAAGGLAQVGILNPATLLYGPLEQQSMQWIGANTPAQARFLINSTHWTGDRITAADGGGWIPAMTGREVQWLDRREDPGQIAAFLTAQKIRYIYLGRFPGFLDPAAFALAPDQYRPVYQQGGVAIYEVIAP